MKFLLLISLVLISLCSQSQIIDPAGATKRKATNRANSKVDQSIDKGLDKIEEGIGNLFKKKKKKDDDKNSASENDEDEDVANNEQNGKDSKPNKENFQSYSKFDFVTGEKVIFFEDFERVDVGDFPADWNTDASGEVVSINSKEGKWLNMTKNGSFIPEAIKELPDNFTLEFEVGIANNPSNNNAGVGLSFHTNRDEQMKWDMTNGSFLFLHPGGSSSEFLVKSEGKDDISNNTKMPQWIVNGARFAKVSIWRQKGRLRVYVNESKIWDVPRFFAETKPYYFSFNRSFFYDCEIFLSNLKLAQGAPDTRSKLITEGKFSTTGILFDVNSDKIKPASAGVLKEIATVLKENPTVRIRIVGHTDSDGDDASNLALSKKRALSVKNALSANFEIDESRMETDGMGETKSVDSNTTPQGKANNRRVEFIKL